MTITQFKIGLDAGHGGRDPGAVGPTRLYEKFVTLDITMRVGAILSPHANIVYTRTMDTDLAPKNAPFSVNACINGRIKVINNAMPNICVSIHTNSLSTKPEAHGLETWIHAGTSRTASSISLAKSIQSRLVKATGLADRGIKEGTFGMIRFPVMTNCLVELPFISNLKEEALMRDSVFRVVCARAIAEGIASHLGMEVGSLAISKAEREYGESAVKSLNKKGLVNNPEVWISKMGESVPNWLFFVMLDRISNK